MSKITIVYDPNGDWGGLYVHGELVQYGHEYSLTEHALDLAGIEVRQVPAEVIMANWPKDNRTVRKTLAEVDAAQADADAITNIADVYAGKA